MIGVVLVTHGHLADEFRSATEHVVGPQNQFVTVCIGPSDNMEEKRQSIIQAVQSVDNEKGVVIFTDMFGGTPSNLAISVMGEGNIEVVAGMNLPMLIKFMSVRGKMNMAEACLAAQDAARKYINVASNLLSRDNSSAKKISGG